MRNNVLILEWFSPWFKKYMWKVVEFHSFYMKSYKYESENHSLHLVSVCSSRSEKLQMDDLGASLSPNTITRPVKWSGAVCNSIKMASTWIKHILFSDVVSGNVASNGGGGWPIREFPLVEIFQKNGEGCFEIRWHPPPSSKKKIRILFISETYWLNTRRK